MKKDKLLYYTLLLSFFMHIFFFGILEFYYRILQKNFFGIQKGEREKIFEVLPYIPKNLPEVEKPKKEARFLGPKNLDAKKQETIPKQKEIYSSQPNPPSTAVKPIEKKEERKTTIQEKEQVAKPIVVPEKKQNDSFKIPFKENNENETKEEKKTIDKTEPKKQDIPGINKLIPKSHDILAKLPKEESINLNSGSVKSGKELIVNTKEFKYWSYLQKMKQKIEMVWEYPEYARQRGIGGQLKINFSIGKDGKIEKMILVDSSGLKVLDDAALKALRDASPFPPFPETWDISRLNIE
ncbi:MAG: energy transducer TonB, partial [candidate division WOR-3 bacterium]